MAGAPQRALDGTALVVVVDETVEVVEAGTDVVELVVVVGPEVVVVDDPEVTVVVVVVLVDVASVNTMEAGPGPACNKSGADNAEKHVRRVVQVHSFLIMVPPAPTSTTNGTNIAQSRVNTK